MATLQRAKVELALKRRASPTPSCGSSSRGINQRRRQKETNYFGLRSSRGNEAQTEKRKGKKVRASFHLRLATARQARWCFGFCFAFSTTSISMGWVAGASSRPSCSRTAHKGVLLRFIRPAFPLQLQIIVAGQAGLIERRNANPRFNCAKK
jgi:hypothetical protein